MQKIKSVFIVDDDIDDREIFVEAIARIDPDIKCYTARDGEDALTILGNNHIGVPEIIFLDLNMPRMDGRQMLIELKKDAVLKNIPVVIYSTSNSKKDMDETLALGAKRFLAKPSEFGELCTLLSAILSSEL
jgi:CheY-like chemotaxis protein